MSVPRNTSGLRGSPSDTPSFAALLQGCFHESPYPALRQVESNVTNGVVQLTGIVPSYYLKQLAQEIALQHAGVKEVNNHIRVG